MVRSIRLSLFWLLCCGACAFAQDASKRTEFFEQHIRPVLVEKCYKCHNSVDTDEGGLALDFRDGSLTETEHGPVIVPGDPAASVLMKVIRHEIDDREMPEDAGRLDDRVIANFEKWILMGAPDPRDKPPSKRELLQATSWETTLANRKRWWSLQPIQQTPPPAVNDIDHPVDRFVREKLRDEGLPPAALADRRTLIRRLSFVLTGLPPSPEQIAAYLEDDRRDAYERLVDELLASDRFGERWARHWMDLMRYADSHGSEGDPAIPEIYRYRDYLIRAFNQDVPYDQLLREHIAGDLLDTPRVNDELGINESLIGPAHWRLVFHGFAPTDALDEKVRFTDDQINVFSKAFLGLTVSCARCHDHKFDAVSQEDYYALFGVLASCRPALRDINLPEKQERHQADLKQRKQAIRHAVADYWLDHVSDLTDRLNGITGDWQKKVASHEKPSQLFYVLAEFQRLLNNEHTAAEAWSKLTDQWSEYRSIVAQDRDRENEWHWDFTAQQDYDAWFRDGNGLPHAPSKAGDFRVESSDKIIAAILPAGVHANTISTKHRSFLGSPRFKLDGDYKVWFRLQGGGSAMSRYAVEHYPRDGTVYPIRDINNERWFLQEYNLKYWNGEFIHLEVNTARDAPLRTRGDERSWFGVREVVLREYDAPKPHAQDREFASPLFAAEVGTPASIDDVVSVYARAIKEAIDAWRDDNLSDAQALLLHECLLEGLLDNSVEQLASLKGQLEEFVSLENAIPTPIRVPGLQEADIVDQPLYVRGNHRQPGSAIARRFLEAIDPNPFTSHQSGRLELAERLVDAKNPLVARIMVNRIWHYVFGQGIVATPDNFGELGTRPSHPQLLDYLATRFKEDWSIKNAIRLLVTSDTFRQTSVASSKASKQDPANRWLSHANVRRLDAESIRDSLLTIAGQMTHDMYGPGFASNSDIPRRAVYVRTRRNSLDQFLEAFNAPVPFATTGRRNVTNVPAQSLTMLNSPFVMKTARAWAKNALAKNALAKDDDIAEARIDGMFESALGRLPRASERTALQGYLKAMEEQATSYDRRQTELSSVIQKLEDQLEELVAPAKKQLLADRADKSQTNQLDPVAAWDFSRGLADLAGELDASVQGKATIEDGALVVRGGFAATGPLQTDLAAKTLAATVQLDDLNQKGGGVIGVQTLDGIVFDSIVFGERKSGHWMSGSNNFKRTNDFAGGSRETKAASEWVHIAIAYDDDGTVRGYRNGQAYGKSIRENELQRYSKGEAQVIFGLRHGDGGGGRLLRGRIQSAQLFDRALSAEEVSALASGNSFVSEKDVLEALDERGRKRLLELQSSMQKQKQALAELGQPIGEQERWARLGHALFNLKEFIYVK